MSVLVTGGGGLIGAEVAHMLSDMGEDVFVLEINPASKLLDDIRGKVEVIKGDLGNYSHVLNAVKAARPSAIYHLGGMLSVPSDADHAASIRANAMGTFHVLEAARLFEAPQVLFSSTIATYGLDTNADVLDDYTLQRPQLFYGCTKVFCENMGLFYKRKFGLDFRGVRYPSIVGPGVKTPGVVQYTSWVIEECAKGRPFTLNVVPEQRCPVMYYKDAASAIIELGRAPLENIKMVNYIIAGPKPDPSAQDLVDVVKSRMPDAQIDFQPDMELKAILDGLLKPLDDTLAQKEWGWAPKYDQERIVEDFFQELKSNPKKYE